MQESRSSFWDEYSKRRVGRRRLLATTAAGAAGTALMAACGADSSDGGSGGRGLLINPSDSTSRAKPGGVLKDFSRDEGGSFDALASGDSTTYDLVGDYTYPGLVKFSTGKFPEESKGEILGDLGESWEISPDRLSIVFKIRPGLKWENKAPVEGRTIDAEDVVASWKKFSVTSSYAGQVAYSASNPSASIVSMDALDASTVRVNLFRPDAAALAVLGWNRTRVLPREFNGGFNPANTVIGYGPYLLQEYTPSVRFVWQRAPNYYVKDRPFIDRIERPIVPDYSTRLAQFRSGSIYTSVVTPEDLLPTKRDLPQLQMGVGSGHIAFNGVQLKFGYEGEGKRFEDIRIRQALNYLIDRRSYEDVLTNRKALASEGIDIESRLATWIGPYWEDFWLDPFDEGKFGQSAKYLHYDLAEAKRLLSAAGFASGFEAGFFYPAGRGGYQQQLADIVPNLLDAGGIKTRAEAVDNNSVFIPNMLRQYTGGKRAMGKASDGLQIIAGGARVTADLSLQNYYDTGGPSFIGMPVNGNGPEVGDPDIVGLVRRMREEFDRNRQVSLSHDLHRLMAERSYSLPLHWSTPTLQLIWPAIGNAGYFTQFTSGTSQIESRLHWWLDTSKPPLAG